jgi:transposase
VIEGSFNTIKNWRGLATSYDKLALTYRAAELLAATCAWLRHVRDTP